METEEKITEPSDEKRFLRFLPTNPMRHLKLLVVVLLHWAVVIGNFSAFFILAFQGLTPFGHPWYICLPLCSFIILISPLLVGLILATVGVKAAKSCKLEPPSLSVLIG